MASNRLKIYIAAPLFTVAEKQFNKTIQSILFQHYYKVFLPQEECLTLEKSKDIFLKCKEGLDTSDVVVAILDGADADSGTCWEVGYSYAKSKPVIILRTDFRGTGDTGGFNAMLYECTPYRIQGLTYIIDLIQTLQKIEKDFI